MRCGAGRAEHKGRRGHRGLQRQNERARTGVQLAGNRRSAAILNSSTGVSSAVMLVSLLSFVLGHGLGSQPANVANCQKSDRQGHRSLWQGLGGSMGGGQQ